jgi:low temperature requirement protein LtrA
VTALQAGWVAWFFAVPHGISAWVFMALVVGELAVPIFAEAAGRTTWHPGHIAERYGLFTIIVLGEAVSAGTIGVQTALDDRTTPGHLATVVVGGLLTVFSMWWLYFDIPSEEIVAAVRRTFETRLNGAFAWGYGHYLVFASAAATGAGLGVAVAQVSHHSKLTHLETGLALTVPVATYLTVVWAIHAPYKPPGRLRSWGVPVAVVLMIGSSATPDPVLATGAVLAGLLSVTIATRHGPPEGTGKAAATYPLDHAAS